MTFHCRNVVVRWKVPDDFQTICKAAYIWDIGLINSIYLKKGRLKTKFQTAFICMAKP